ncbi:MAG: SLC13 family permease [Methylotetracoccus sp.]
MTGSSVGWARCESARAASWRRLFCSSPCSRRCSATMSCLAVAPVLLELCRARRLDTTPFLLGLACAANIGSAATLIGNPQNMLIGGRLGLHFADYLAAAAAPVAGSLVATWLVIAWLWRRGWSEATPLADTPRTVAEVSRAHPLSRWQAAKGLAVAGALFVLFLFSDWSRELVALAGAGVLLLSRKLHSRQMLGLVDWQALLLFIGLFIVNDALERTGLPGHAVDDLAAVGIDLHAPAALYGVTFVLSNLVSNVPAVMLLLPIATPDQGVLLALSSTLAGNLFIVGSIANIIVVDAAARGGSPIGWRQHARVGVPVTLLSLAISAASLFAR